MDRSGTVVALNRVWTNCKPYLEKIMKYLFVLMLALLTSSAFAKDASNNQSSEAIWKKECSSCHIAYPPRFLTADNWQGLMKSLNNHFGSNAELDVEDNLKIVEYLKLHAGNGNKHHASTLRISDTYWFKREHHEISRKTWDIPSIKSPANCTSCHINAERGDWSERGVRIPKPIQ